MKTLKEAIQDYLALRRSLGFKLKKHSRFLEEFALFLEQAGELRITSRLALQWATQPQQIQQSEWAARLSVVRGFARYWSATDPMTEIPPEGLLPYRPRRAKPYLYSDEQIQQLLEAAKNMPTTHSLQPWTYHCLFGLLAVTGLRISEALNLRSTDVDWLEGILTIRDSKFGKSRLIPLHASSLNVLSDYGARRDLLFAHRKTPYFFCSRLDGRLDEGQVRRVFYVISRQIGIRGASASRGPRLHDFRHRFAVQTLLHWHRTGEDVRRRLPILSTYLGHRHVTDTYWYGDWHARTDGDGGAAAGQALGGNLMKDAVGFPTLLEMFFTRRLIAQRRASPHTIASYRDTFRLLLQFAQKQLAKAPSRLTMEDLNAPFLGAFLDHLETTRTNGARSRNLRLTAIRSFFRFAALETPQHSGLIQRVLVIPNKRQPRPLVGFLTRPEIDALLAIPDRNTWLGRRDHALLLTALQTGLRLTEITSIRQQDVSLATGAHVRCEGKGRKERCTPLTKSTVTVLTAWIGEQGVDGTRILFPSVRGGRLSADAVQHLVTKYAALAQQACPSLADKHISPHVLRHTTAMELMQAGVDRTLIALWLGHESVETTQIYLDANLTIKEEALSKLTPINTKTGRYQPDDDLLAFLKGL
jgi:site-specific recombinase XerD